MAVPIPLVPLVLLVAVTALLLLLEAPLSVRVSADLDLARATFMGFAAISSAMLSWARYRETARAQALFEASAYAMLSTAWWVIFLSVAVRTDLDARVGFWILTLAMSVCGILLAVGVRRRLDERPAPTMSPVVVALAPAGLFLLVLVPTFLLPAIVPDVVDAALVADVTSGRSPVRHLGLGAILLQAPGIVAFAVASAGYARLYERHRHSHDLVVATALFLAASSMVFFALSPLYLSGLLGVADTLRFLFLALVLVAAVRAWRFDMRALRQAYEDEVRLREADVRRAAMGERARLAREIHDKLVQALWVARLRAGHLLATDLPPDAQALAETMVRALDDGLAESREAIMVLSTGPDGPDLVDRHVRASAERLADGLGLDVRVSTMGDFRPIEPGDEAEVLTILREALTNTAKHAHARQVRVSLISDREGLLMEIADDGTGFDPAAEPSGLGLHSMRARAASIGARLAVQSEARTGTRIVLQLPYPDDGAPA
jgi:signal transduction histidine kinase